MRKIYQKNNKLIKCFLYKNTYEIPTNIKKLTLYTINKNFFLNSIIQSCTCLELIAKQKAFLIRSKRSSAFKKIKKGLPIGAKITLRKNKLNLFLLNLI